MLVLNFHQTENIRVNRVQCCQDLCPLASKFLSGIRAAAFHVAARTAYPRRSAAVKGDKVVQNIETRYLQVRPDDVRGGSARVGVLIACAHGGLHAVETLVEVQNTRYVSHRSATAE